MFHIDCTFEDCRIIATSKDGITYDGTVYDNASGESRSLPTVASDVVQRILAFNLHPDGEPEGFKESYKILEPLFADWPNNLRPIP